MINNIARNNNSCQFYLKFYFGKLLGGWVWFGFPVFGPDHGLVLLTIVFLG